MTGLGKYKNGGEHNSKDSERVGDQWKIDFILANKKFLVGSTKGLGHLSFVGDMRDLLKEGGSLSPKQSSYLDGLYEKVFEEWDNSAPPGATKVGSFKATYKPGKKRLRY